MTDILLVSGDLCVENGDFTITEDKEQRVFLIVESVKTDFKQFPFIGFDIQNYIKANTDRNKFKRNLKVAIEVDGIVLDNIKVSSDLRHLDFEIV